MAEETVTIPVPDYTAQFAAIQTLINDLTTQVSTHSSEISNINTLLSGQEKINAEFTAKFNTPAAESVLSPSTIAILASHGIHGVS